MQLPKKKYVFTYKNNYGIGCNSVIDDVEYLCSRYNDEITIADLVGEKNFALDGLKRDGKPLFKGRYDCLVEIEKLNRK